jgi:hypothetical protein
MRNETMEIKEFAEELRKEMESRLGVRIEINDMIKNNGLKHKGLTFFREGCNISPTIYVDEYYEIYIDKGFEEAVKEVQKQYEMCSFEGADDFKFFQSFEGVRDKVRCRVVNSERNEELLRDVPHRHFLDLAIIYHVEYFNSEIGAGAIIIHNNHIEKWGVNEEKLMETALENMKDEIKVASLYEKLKDRGVDLVDELDDENDSAEIYIMTNGLCSYGAAGLLLKDKFKELSERIEADKLLIIPSSVHELLIVRCESEEETGEYRRTLKEINKYGVAEVEFLSNNVYVYDAATDTISIA